MGMQNSGESEGGREGRREERNAEEAQKQRRKKGKERERGEEEEEGSKGKERKGRKGDGWLAGVMVPPVIPVKYVNHAKLASLKFHPGGTLLGLMTHARPLLMSLSTANFHT